MDIQKEKTDIQKVKVDIRIYINVNIGKAGRGYEGL